MILIVDDDKSVRLSLGVLLKRAGYAFMTAASPQEALDLMRKESFSLVLMDMNYSISTTGEEGLHLLRQTAIFQPGVPVILITAWGSIELAVEGMKAGAFDFVTKPWSNTDLLARIESAVTLSSETERDHDEFDRCGIVGRNASLCELLDTVARVAPTDAPVLILGENGTGKELIAKAVHANSRRARNPFVMVNLGGISQSLFESEMFGHAKGAFTGASVARKGRFELADKGTIFLDEIGDLDLSCQVKMLRVLQQHTFEPLGESRPRKVDIRVVCATNADLSSMVAERSFREDLYYRINLVTLRLPSLRERRDDIPLLVNHFIRDAAKELGLPMAEISDEAMTYLCRLPYPGNIRQLKNMVQRAVITSGGGMIVLKDVCDRMAEIPRADSSDVSGSAVGLDELERKAILAALKECGGNMTRTSLKLGISRQALYRRMAKYGLES